MIMVASISNPLETIENVQQTALVIFAICCIFAIVFEVTTVSDRVVHLWGIMLFSSAFVAFCMTMIIIWS